MIVLTKRQIIFHHSLLTILFCIVVLPLIQDNQKLTSQRWDQKEYHLPQIQYFAYNSFIIGQPYAYHVPMTPGHHILLSRGAYLFPGKIDAKNIWMRIYNSIFGLLFLITAWWLVYFFQRNSLNTTILILPLLSSSYVLGSSIWITTDNGALLWISGSLLLLCTGKVDRNKILLASFTVAYAILWRQVHAWLLIPLFIKTWQFALNEKKFWIPLFALWWPVTVLFYFFILWKALLPLEWTRQQQSPSNTIFIICYISIIILFVVVFWFRDKLQKYFVVFYDKNFLENNHYFSGYFVVCCCTAFTDCVNITQCQYHHYLRCIFIWGNLYIFFGVSSQKLYLD